MARYTGPRTKKARTFGEPIYGFDKAFEKKKYPPGQHGLSKKRKSLSEYGLQLMEKQKAKYTYGVLERQFAKTFDTASRKKGATGDNLLQLLEARLDNTVFRLGIAKTRRAARQFVTHKHITVNGNIVNIPSFSLKPGDRVGVAEKSKNMEPIQNAIAARTQTYPWLEWEAKDSQGVFLTMPERDQIPENIQVHLIVELYSK